MRNSTFGLPSKLGFLLCKLVLRLSKSSFRRQQKQQQIFWNIRLAKLCGGIDWLELLVCLSSDQAIEGLLFRLHGMQKQHFVVSISSPKII